MARSKIDWLYHGLSLIVVFIGITAGFVLQNKKDIRNDKKAEQKYFEGFASDINQDIESLTYFISDDSAWVALQTPKFVAMFSDSLSWDSANALMKSMLSFSEFKPHDDTYTTILNSGNLGLIRNFKVRQQVVEYYKQVEDYMLIGKYFHKFNTDNFMPFLFENYDIVGDSLVDRSLMTSPLFRNISGAYLSYSQQREKGFSALRTKSQETLKVIKEQL